MALEDQVRLEIELHDELLVKAQKLTGLTSHSALVDAGLRALVERENARLLSRLGGTDPEFEPGPRRRPPS